MRRLILTSLVWAALAVPAVSDPVADADDAAARMQGAAIVVLGEVHDNPEHHAIQRAIADLVGARALVFEMLSPTDAGLITPELARDPAAMRNALDWENSGWPDFSMYAPLLALGAEVPVYGAEVPREAAQGAFEAGAAAVFDGDAARFALTEPLAPDEQAAREAEQLSAHCDALPADILPGFVEAQRLRDATLAQAALDALERHGAPVVVITGNGHARKDWGVPALVAIAAPEVDVFSLGQFEAPPEGRVPFDAWTVAPPVDRPDPCEAFR